MTKDLNLSKEELAIGQIAANILEVPVEKFLHENSLPYSWYVIRSRALVSVDGLKPVQRRILYSMFMDKIGPNASHKKAATIAGNTMGVYHPHGNVSIEDALSRMAQWFTMRVPLIDPNGSVGYFTGDPASAARYWEARMTKAGYELVREVDDNALEMSTNYDGTVPEPAVLPARWPSALINGTQGIAVGYASTMLPHNPTEVMKAVIAMVRDPKITLDKLMKIMPGPDFPTGGEIIGHEGLRDCYMTGRGSFVVRGRYTVKPITRGRSIVEFYELPYQISADDVIAKINSSKKNGTLPEVTKASDLSDNARGLRLSITLKSGVNVDATVEKIFKLTPASKSFSFNQTVLESGSPSQLNLFEIIQQFVDFRKMCIRNVTSAKYEKTSRQLSNNEGLIKVIFDIDKTLKIITKSKDEEDAKAKLIKTYKLTEDQAVYVLGLQLKRLTRADRESLIAKNKELELLVKELYAIMNDEEVFKEELIKQLKDTMKIIGDPRRTIINNKTAEEIKEEELAAKAQAAAVSSNASYVLQVNSDGTLVKSLETAGSAAQRGKVPFAYKMIAKTEDPLFAVIDDGTAVKFPSTYIPFDKKVEPSSIDIGKDYLSIGKTISGKKDYGLLVVTNSGRAGIVNGRFPTTLEEFPLVSLDENERIIFSTWLTKDDAKKNLMIASSNGFVTVFAIDQLRVSNPGAQPIRGMVIADDAEAIGASLVGDKGAILTYSKNTLKLTNMKDIPVRNRGAKGTIIQRLTKGESLIGAFGAERSEIGMTDILGNEFTLPSANARAATGRKFATSGLLIGYKHLDDITDKLKK